MQTQCYRQQIRRQRTSNYCNWSPPLSCRSVK